MHPLLDRLTRWIRALPQTLRGRATKASGPDQWLACDFVHQHRSVSYKLYVPAKGGGAQRPLLLMLHGCTQDPDDFANGTRMNRLARERGFLVLYPAQSKQANAGKCWNWFVPQHQGRERGEPALLAALVQSVMAEHAVDPERVYVAGLSAGGAMACVLARTHPEMFAAVGVHSGLAFGAASSLMAALSVMKNGGPAFHKAEPMPPTIVFHGDADETVHPSNGEQVARAAAAGKETGALQMNESAGRSGHGRAFTRQVYADGHGVIHVEYWVVHGAGHAWAGGSSEGSFTDPTGPDASAEMLRFFLEHPQRRQVAHAN